MKDINIIQELVDKETPQQINYSYDGYSDGNPVTDLAECPNCGKEFE